MSPKDNETIPLKGKRLTSDPAMERVITAQSKMQDMTRQLLALKAERKMLLEEYMDFRNARPVPKARPSSAAPAKAETVRMSFGDVHGMMMDKDAVAALLRDLRVIKPNVIVIGGDIVECGGWLAKHQPVGFIALCDYSYQEDIKAATWFLDEVQAAVPEAEIHYLEGNHEDRVERWCVDQTMSHERDSDFLRRAFSPSSLLRLEERGIAYYRRSVVYGEGLPRGWFRLGKMLFTHELGASANAAREAVSKSAANVTYFHTHRADMAIRVFPGVGICSAFNPGCLCSMQPVWQNSNVTDWSQGYAVDFIAKSGNFQRTHVPIWKGESLAGAMVERFRA